MKVGRTLFWFKEADGNVLALNEKFFGLGTMLNRLLNEKYNGKKLGFVNINYAAAGYYKEGSVIPVNQAYYYGGDLTFYGIIDMPAFKSLRYYDQCLYLWNSSCQYLQQSAIQIENENLFNAVGYAHQRGLELHLNQNYIIDECSFKVGERNCKAILWMKFEEDRMFAAVEAFHNEGLLLREEIASSRNGNEFFLEIFKKVEFDGAKIVVKGRKEVEYLPLVIPLGLVLGP